MIITRAATLGEIITTSDLYEIRLHEKLPHHWVGTCPITLRFSVLVHPCTGQNKDRRRDLYCKFDHHVNDKLYTCSIYYYAKVDDVENAAARRNEGTLVNANRICQEEYMPFTRDWLEVNKGKDNVTVRDEAERESRIRLEEDKTTTMVARTEETSDHAEAEVEALIAESIQETFFDDTFDWSLQAPTQETLAETASGGSEIMDELPQAISPDETVDGGSSAKATGNASGQ